MQVLARGCGPWQGQMCHMGAALRRACVLGHPERDRCFLTPPPRGKPPPLGILACQDRHSWEMRRVPAAGQAEAGRLWEWPGYAFGWPLGTLALHRAWGRL